MVSSMPGMDTGAPERTLTSSGSPGSPKARPTRFADARHLRLQLGIQARSASRRARRPCRPPW